MKRVFYWKGEAELGDVPNFGDALNSWILDRLGVEHEWAKPEEAELFLGGSILHKIPKDYYGTVIGTGTLYENDRRDLRYANVCAVRGELTRERITTSLTPALGDPGLLVPLWVPMPPSKYALGVIPHWSDKELGRKYSYGHVIDVRRPVGEVLNEIAMCKNVISSSLHGVIVADAFGIPRRAELPPSALTNKWEGGEFKWLDYNSIYSTSRAKIRPHFGEFWTAPRDLVKKHQSDVRQAFAKAGIGYKPANAEVS